MKINTINIQNGFVLNKPAENKKQQNNTLEKNRSTSNYISYPKNYYISFQGASFDEVNERYKETMPQTVKDYLDVLSYLSSDSEIEELREKGFIVAHKKAFAALEDCKTIDDIKNSFPNEPAFKNLITPAQLSQKETGIFAHMRDLEQKGIKILNTEEDVTTFIVKKIYLECLEYREIYTQLIDALSTEAKKNGLAETLENIPPKRRSQSNLYRQLGLIPLDGRAYAVAVRYSDFENEKTRRKYFSNLTAEETNEKISKLLSEKDKKAKYSMMEAWNNCPEIREELSHFLTLALKNPIYYTNELSLNENLTIYDARFYTKMHNIMVAFWNKNPEYKEKIGEEIAKAIAKYNQIAALGEEELEKYIESVKKKSQEIRNNIQLKKLEDKAQYQKAIQLIERVTKGSKVFSIEIDSTLHDFANLLLDRFSQKELETLEGNPDSENFRKLVPNGIKEKLRETVSSSEFINIYNAYLIAILTELENSNISDDEKENLIELCKKSPKEAMKQLANSKAVETIDLVQIEGNYNRFKSPLTRTESEELKWELVQIEHYFNEKEIENIDNILLTQGKYLKFALNNDSSLRELSEMLFWSEYDRIYGTEYSQIISKKQDLDKIFSQAIEHIDLVQLDSLALNW